MARVTRGKTWDEIYADAAFVAAKREAVAALGRRPKSLETRAKIGAARRAMARSFEEILALPATMARFLAKVECNGPVPSHRPDLGPCWVWLASLKHGEYGGFGVGSRMWDAHRIAYLLFVGPIPLGMELDHLCRVHRCVNPTHLEPVTRGENIARGLRGVLYEPPTHCKRGHPFSEANTRRVGPTEKLVCRACARERMRAYRTAGR